MTSDLIRRSDAIEAILRARIPHSTSSAWYTELAINAVRTVPSADRPQDDEFKNFDRGDLIALIEAQKERIGELLADRPQGEWVDMGDFEKCSVCKCTHLKEFQSYYGKVTWMKTPYCPQCGARMKGADDESTL